MKNVLVTGGTGFLGSNLAIALLEQACNVRILRRATSDLRAIGTAQVSHSIGDIRNPEDVRKAVIGCDTVFHTAALVSYWSRQRQLLFDINIGGTKNVVDACLDAGVEKLVHTSSIAAIGFPGDGILADETVAFNPEEQDVGYRISKHQAEAEVLRGVNAGLPAVILNPSLIMGPRDVSFNAGQIVRDVYRGRLFFYTRGGVSMVSVGDVVRGHLEAVRRGRVGERYILAGENLTHREIIRTTAEVVGHTGPIFRIPMTLARSVARLSEAIGNMTNRKPWVGRELVVSLDQRRWFSSAKAARELGYTITPFRETVRQTFEWYRQNGFL